MMLQLGGRLYLEFIMIAEWLHKVSMFLPCHLSGSSAGLNPEKLCLSKVCERAANARLKVLHV